jgi:hypothetical protein
MGAAMRGDDEIVAAIDSRLLALRESDNMGSGVARVQRWDHSTFFECAHPPLLFIFLVFDPRTCCKILETFVLRYLL